MNLLVAQCTHGFRVRGWRGTSPSPSGSRREADFRALAGEGQIVVTVEATDRASSYQGVVPIAGDSLAAIPRGLFRAIRATADPRLAGREFALRGRACCCSACPNEAASLPW